MRLDRKKTQVQKKYTCEFIEKQMSKEPFLRLPDFLLGVSNEINIILLLQVNRNTKHAYNRKKHC